MNWLMMRVMKQLDLPLGRMLAVFAACLTTVVGVIVGHDPEVILLRACCSIPIAAFAGFVIGRMLYSLAQRKPK